ncbi:MAG: hypothetical protein ACREN6_03135 [Gemmatimonadaceae bacterium]
MGAVRANVEIIEGAFLAGALFTRDGVLTVFRKGFAPEHVRDAMRQVSLDVEVASFKITKTALKMPPLPLGAVFGVLFSVVTAAVGKHMSEAHVVLQDGAALRLRAEPSIMEELERAISRGSVTPEKSGS